MKANAAYGNKTKSYAIVEFLKTNQNTSTELLEKMKTNRWISKLKRVVSFSLFKDVYNIQFNIAGITDQRRYQNYYIV